MEMIVIGGMIGLGLFMGVMLMIKWIGFLVLLVYVFVGMVLYGVMWVFGEMVYLMLGIGLFVDYGLKYIYLVVGYLVKWSNVF